MVLDDELPTNGVAIGIGERLMPSCNVRCPGMCCTGFFDPFGGIVTRRRLEEWCRRRGEGRRSQGSRGEGRRRQEQRGGVRGREGVGQEGGGSEGGSRGEGARRGVPRVPPIPGTSK